MLQNEKWKEELEKIASIFHELPFEKATKWGADVFMINGKNVASFGGFKHFFTIWFYNGVFLKDPEKVLINANEGKTKSLRQWRFTSINQIDESKIKAYLLEAIDNERKGLRIEKSQPVSLPVPELLAKELAYSSELNEAFKRLSPGKQKEFINYLNEAKTDATKQRRVEKIKSLVKLGLGLNDKYK